MAAKPMSVYPTEKQREKWAKYLLAHGIDSATAGRIAIARLLAEAPTEAEIAKATVQRSLENLKQFRKS